MEVIATNATNQDIMHENVQRVMVVAVVDAVDTAVDEVRMVEVDRMEDEVVPMAVQIVAVVEEVTVTIVIRPLIDQVLVVIVAINQVILHVIVLRTVHKSSVTIAIEQDT